MAGGGRRRAGWHGAARRVGADGTTRRDRVSWGTLAVNLSGAFAAGVLAGLLGMPHGELSPAPAWLGLVVGGLGGYTTVSSLSLQTLALWQSGRTHAALANLGATLGAGLTLAALGWWLGGVAV
ncbi:CrcB family protein [Halomonas sp. E19]|uniref:CrcB family protein n=1 Tax=Halomonas sp. E19 TaxID=3397247 RepID=UPI00403384E0